jgi:hypothetical protein
MTNLTHVIIHPKCRIAATPIPIFIAVIFFNLAAAAHPEFLYLVIGKLRFFFLGGPSKGLACVSGFW